MEKFFKSVVDMKFNGTTYYKQVPNLQKIGNHIIKLIEKHGNPMEKGTAIWQEYKTRQDGGMTVSITVFVSANTNNRTLNIYDFDSKESVIKKLEVIDKLFKGEIKTIEELEKFGF